MSGDRLRELLAARAPRDWELYRKVAESRELASAPTMRREAWRRERGWAARWWEDGAPRFCAASTPQSLEAAIPAAARMATVPSDPPAWPSGTATPLEPKALESPPDLFGELARLVSAESRGEAVLTRLVVRRGTRSEGLQNAAGLDVSDVSERLDGFVGAVGRRGARACDAILLLRWDAAPDLPGLARRIADRVTLPLSDKPAPFDRGEWLLDPSVSASLLAALTPLFTGAAGLRWRSGTAPFSRRVNVVDDATADARYDGEGTPSRRISLVEEGALRGPLNDLRAARATGQAPTGHGVRSSYRTPPAVAPRRIFFVPERADSAPDLLARVRRGIFAAAVTAPVVADFENDRYEVEFTGVAVIAGRAQGPVAAARASGRLSELLQRIVAASTDRQFFALPHPVGAPTLLIERASFE